MLAGRDESGRRAAAPSANAALPVKSVEHETERVQIAARGRAAPVALLGCHVGRCTRRDAQLRALVCKRGKAEVGDARAPATINEHVRGLEITMQHAEVVRCGQNQGATIESASSPCQVSVEAALDLPPRASTSPRGERTTTR